MISQNQLFNLFLFFILTILAEVLGTVGGFGSSLFFVSLLQLFFGFSSVLMLTGLLHIFSNTSKIILFRKSIDWKLTARLGISSLIFAIGGAYLTKYVNLQYMKMILGMFLVLLSALFLAYPDFTLKPDLKNSITGGAVSGFLAGFIGTGGAIRGLVLASFNLEKNLLVGTSAAIDFCVDLSRSLIYFQNGFFKKEMWMYLPVMLIASFFGTYIGKMLLKAIPQVLFQKILLALVSAMGLLMIFNR